MELDDSPGIRLELTAWYKDPIWSCDDACGVLVSLVDTSALFDVGKRAFATLRPRKNWETELGVTVGSIRATKGGQYYVGKRDMPDGIAKRNDLQSVHRLGDYTRHHWGEPITIDVGATFSREFNGVPTRATMSASVLFRSAEAKAWAGDFSDAMFELFVAALGVSAPLTARASWWSHPSTAFEYERLAGMWVKHEQGEAIVPGTRVMVHLSAADVRLLGGMDAVRRAAPVLDVREVLRDGSEVGVAARLCRTPEELTEDRLREWRRFLLPVLDLPREAHRPVDWEQRNPNGWLAQFRRPLDILSSDFIL